MMERVDHDWYAVLGVAASAPLSEIKSNYQRLVRELHPDKCSGAYCDGGGDRAAFTAVQSAWEVLRDPAARAEYDAERNRTCRPPIAERAVLWVALRELFYARSRVSV